MKEKLFFKQTLIFVISDGRLRVKKINDDGVLMINYRNDGGYNGVLW